VAVNDSSALTFRLVMLLGGCSEVIIIKTPPTDASLAHTLVGLRTIPRHTHHTITVTRHAMHTPDARIELASL